MALQIGQRIAVEVEAGLWYVGTLVTTSHVVFDYDLPEKTKNILKVATFKINTLRGKCVPVDFTVRTPDNQESADIFKHTLTTDYKTWLKSKHAMGKFDCVLIWAVWNYIIHQTGEHVKPPLAIVIKAAQGIAARVITRGKDHPYYVQVSSMQHFTRFGFFSTLAHEFCHILQQEQGLSLSGEDAHGEDFQRIARHVGEKLGINIEIYVSDEDVTKEELKEIPSATDIYYIIYNDGHGQWFASYTKQTMKSELKDYIIQQVSKVDKMLSMKPDILLFKMKDAALVPFVANLNVKELKYHDSISQWSKIPLSMVDYLKEHATKLFDSKEV